MKTVSKAGSAPTTTSSSMGGGSRGGGGAASRRAAKKPPPTEMQLRERMWGMNAGEDIIETRHVRELQT